MKKNGFTLIELLGVIALLAVLSLIAVPAIDTAIKSSREKLTETQEKQIVKGAREYYAEHLDLLPQNNADVSNVTLKTLQDGGYLPLNFKNPETEEKYDYNATFVKVTKDGQNFKYEVQITEGAW